MGSKRPKPEEIVSKLRQVEVLQGQCMSIADAVRQIAVTQQTFYRWRKLHGGMQPSQLTQLKELEKEHQRPRRRAVSDLTLDKLILTKAAQGAEGQQSTPSKPFAPPQMHRPCPTGARRFAILADIDTRPMASDEYSKEALTIRVARRLNSTDVVDALTDLFILRGVPEFIRSDNGPEFIAEKVRTWIAAVGAKTAFIEPGSPWENGYCESFNARFRDELLDGEIFYSLREAKILIWAARWGHANGPTGVHSTISGSVRTVRNVEVASNGVRRSVVEINGQVEPNNGRVLTLFPADLSDQRIVTEFSQGLRNRATSIFNGRD